MGQRTKQATHLIKLCCQTALGIHDHLSIYGTDYDTPDGTCIRDYVHVEDLASAHLAALEYLSQGKPSTSLNVGYGKGSSVREVVELAKQVTGIAFATRELPRRPGDPPYLVAQAHKILRTLNWLPRMTGLGSIIQDAWRWEQHLAGIKRTAHRAFG
jgi:UDP-glucose 4-epimerase